MNKTYKIAVAILVIIVIAVGAIVFITVRQNTDDNSMQTENDSEKETDGESLSNDVGYVALVEINGISYSYEYIKYTQAELAEMGNVYEKGEALADEASIYTVKGRNDLIYLYNDNDEFGSGWHVMKFAGCGEEDVAFETILQDIYGVETSEEIDKIIIEVFAENEKENDTETNTDSITITDEAAIKTIYNAIIGIVTTAVDEEADYIDTDNGNLYMINITLSDGEAAEFIYDRKTGYLRQNSRNLYFKFLSDDDNKYFESLIIDK